jgi:ATP-dependent Lon protease
MGPVPPPLRDRMEVIELPGYSDREKVEIARRYLVLRQLKENGLTAEQCSFDTPALESLINDYTREAGVRSLERQIGAVCRAIGALVARGQQQNVLVTPAIVHSILGPPKYVRESDLKAARPGFVMGLAWTPVGGEILYIEAIRYPGKSAILLTGQIGDVMKESAQAALSMVKNRAAELGIAADAFRGTDLHIHVPAGAVPKDGPSAGAAIFTAIASLFSNRVVRSDVAMTGEISLRGLVRPIGGLKEKILAAERAGVTTVIIPKLNEKDLIDVPEEVKAKLKIVPVETVDEVLAIALEPALARETAVGTKKQRRTGPADEDSAKAAKARSG